MLVPLLRRAPIAVGLTASSLLLFAGCGAKQDAPATAAAPTTVVAPTTVADASADSNAANAASASSGDQSSASSAAAPSDGCPAAGVITVHTDAGDKTLTVSSAKASITLDSTMQIGIGNFDVTDDQVEAIAPPKLTGDQLYVNVYLSANKGKIEPGTYISVADELGPLQLNSSEADTADGKVWFTGFANVKENVKITKVDKAAKKVCGTITTQIFDGSFSADIIE